MRFAVTLSLPAAGGRSEVRFCIARLLCDESLFGGKPRKEGFLTPAKHTGRKTRASQTPFPPAAGRRNDEFELFQQAARKGADGMRAGSMAAW